MFFLMDQPTEQEFQNLARRYRQMDPLAVKAMVTLLRTGSDVLAGFEKLLGGYGLSQGRFLILVIMNRNPGEPTLPSVLAQKIGVTRATMTGLIDGLEKEGLIRRYPHETDRRKLRLKLTTKGRDVLESILPDYWTRIHNLMGALTETERGTLIALLEKVNTGISELTVESEE